MDADQLLELATQRHHAGDLSEARRLYQEALAIAPANPVAMVRSGLLELQEGRAEIALVLVEKAISVSPNHARYEFVRGEVLASLTRWDQAIAAYRKSLRVEPSAFDVNFSMGRALQSIGDFRAAISAYETATQSKADFADAFNNIGNCYQLLGDMIRAEESYRHALKLRPNFAGAMSNLSVLLTHAGKFDQAVALLTTAQELEPNNLDHAVNLGATFYSQRKFAEAIAVLRPPCQRDPSNPKAAYNYGSALAGLGQLAPAAEQFARAAQLQPDYIEALNNLGNVSKELGQFKRAGEAFEAALRAQPNSIITLNNLGCMMRSLGRLEEARVVISRGLQLDPNHSSLCNNLANVLKDSGDLEQAIHFFRRALAIDPTNAGTHSNLAYALSFCELDSKAILDECLRWNAQHAARWGSEFRFDSIERSADRRLRIGYVSPDFRDHCQSLFTIPLLSFHDRAAFEIYCYSSVERPDAVTRRIANLVDQWREVRSLNDAELCDLIRADHIDILVDLTMHMANGRPLVFARRAAPVQVAWLAYPGTTGLATMDYRLTDPRLDPPGSDDNYSERTIRLPDSFWCYDPLTTEPIVNELPALTSGRLTLGCLNNPCKLSDHTLRLWSGVMRGLPDARLLLMVPPGEHRKSLLNRMEREGILADRVEFVAYRPRGQYLQTYNQIDLGLDTFPYNGHTTSLDSFWMGVPVVSRIGPTCVGRGGLSQLFQLDLLDLAAETDQDFIDTAIALGRDLPRLARLRQELRKRLETSSLMDAKRFARNMETAYQQMFRDGRSIT